MASAVSQAALARIFGDLTNKYPLIRGNQQANQLETKMSASEQQMPSGTLSLLHRGIYRLNCSLD
jgi:hypothetical protein